MIRPAPGTARLTTALVATLVLCGPAIAEDAVSFEGNSSALRRLSRDEIRATVQMLVGSAPARDELPEDPRPADGMLETAGRSLIATEVGLVRQVLRTFAAKVAPATLTRAGCTLSGPPQRRCLLAWSLRFADQALRRPVRPEERKIFEGILAVAGTAGQDVGTVEGILTAVFFSPSFLYRIEVGKPILQPRNVANRLSFLATLAPPDEELLQAASAGLLQDPAERVRQFDRLLKTEPGRRALVPLVLEWLGAGESKVGEKSGKYRKLLDGGFESSIRVSAEEAIRRVLDEEEDPSIERFLSTQNYLADPAVRRITDPAGDGKNATGDPSESTRYGLLMHPYVLAAHTKEDGASPFPIGKFIRERLLCEPIPPPPPAAAAAALSAPTPGVTIREDLEDRTSDGPSCTACHKKFAPFGYSFLSFDPVGRWVKEDPSGQAWDLAGSVRTRSGAELSFDSPGDLMRSLAARPEVHACFAQAELTWAFGREPIPEDQDLLVALDEVVKRGGGVISVLRTLVAAPEFITATEGK